MTPGEVFMGLWGTCVPQVLGEAGSCDNIETTADREKRPSI